MPKKKHHSHDSIFKALLEDYPVDFLHWVFPNLRINYGEVIENSLLKEEAKKSDFMTQKLVMDTVAKYRFNKGEVILVLYEFQHDRSKFNIHRLAHYFISLLERHPNTKILPVVVFTDQQGMRTPPPKELKMESDGILYLKFTFKYLRLQNLETINHIGSSNPVEGLLAPLMHHDKEKKAELYLKNLLELEKRIPLDLCAKYFYAYEQYLATDEEQYIKFQNMIRKENNMLIYDEIKQEGKLEGIKLGEEIGLKLGEEKGLKLGEEIGKRKTIKNLLKLKFREVPVEYINLVDSLELEELGKIEASILSASTIEETFAGIKLNSH